jgi:hypothetical protein
MCVCFDYSEAELSGASVKYYEHHHSKKLVTENLPCALKTKLCTCTENTLVSTVYSDNPTLFWQSSLRHTGS